LVVPNGEQFCLPKSWISEVVRKFCVPKKLTSKSWIDQVLKLAATYAQIWVLNYPSQLTQICSGRFGKWIFILKFANTRFVAVTQKNTDRRREY
jgi:hypothetical protein